MIPLDIVILRYFLIFETHEAIPIKVFHDRYQFPFYLWRIEAIPKYYKITKYHDHDFLKNGLNFSNDHLTRMFFQKKKNLDEIYVFLRFHTHVAKARNISRIRTCRKLK